jgi:hypothetical protein
MLKFYNPSVADRKAEEFILGLARLFDEYRVSDSEFTAIRRRIRETTFSGTSYAPLPSEPQLIELIIDVQRGQAVNNQGADHHPTMPATETKEDEFGVMICGDGEKVVRDRYFFRNLVTLGEALGKYQYPPHWIDEAVLLMDEWHRDAYRRSTDDAERMMLLRIYYGGLNLPPRSTRTTREVDGLRERGVYRRELWSRYENQSR